MRASPLLAGVALALAAGSVATAATTPVIPERPLPPTKRAEIAAPFLEGLQIANGSTPFEGDGPLLATLSPNADGFRDRATVRFRLDRAARVTIQVFTTRKAFEEIVHQESRRYSAGRHTIRWKPPVSLEPRTYLVGLTVEDADGRRRLYGCPSPSPCKLDPAPVIRVQGVDAAFSRRSYLPGETATLLVATDARRISVQLFRSGPEAELTTRNDELLGVPVGEPVSRSWLGKADRPTAFPVPIGSWASGLYFARVETGDGRVGFAPFVVRPAEPGVASRIAVVLPTDTWQAYNFRDGDGDGWGDTWYASDREREVRLTRAFLDRGVPPRFRSYDLPFLRWLAQRGHTVDVLAEEDVEAFGNGDTLARIYDLVVFPGHSEYVTRTTYDVITRYRDVGGNLMFLSANSFFWRVDRGDDTIQRIRQWRDLGRPEAALLGVQYRGNDDGSAQEPFVVTGASVAPWVFDGTGLVDGSLFGTYGIEVDQRTDASPPGTIVLATIPDLFGPGYSAEMTYYETPAGARVFAAGVLAWGGSVSLSPMDRLLDNLWARLALP